MTKKMIALEIRNIQYELDWLLWCERKNNPDWRFRSSPYISETVGFINDLSPSENIEKMILDHYCPIKKLFD